MKFECVGGVPVRDLRVEIRWQVDDSDGVEWTSKRNVSDVRQVKGDMCSLFNTDTTANA